MKASLPISISVCLRNSTELTTWLTLPVTELRLKTALGRIFAQHEFDYEIVEYANTVPGLTNDLLICESLERVNYLASRLERLSEYMANKLTAIAESELPFKTLDEFIEFTWNNDIYDFYPDVHTVEELARVYLGKRVTILPPIMREPMNLITLGLNMLYDERGQFTSKGYLCRNEKRAKRQTPERYIPQKYRISYNPI